jgi:hypothetical protein
MLAQPDDTASYVDAIGLLSTDAQLYANLVEETRRLRAQILDDRSSLLNSLRALNVPSAAIKRARRFA